MKCPGQDSRYWKPGAIFDAKCPKCGTEIEFFKDDTRRTCKKCGAQVMNPEMDFGCAAYCPYAEQCLGNLPPELSSQKEQLVKERMIQAVKKTLGKNAGAVARAARFFEVLEEIAKKEGAELGVVITASAVWLLNKEGIGERTVELLKDAGATDELISSGMKIVEELEKVSSPGEGLNGLNSMVVSDAIGIVLLEFGEKQKESGAKEVQARIKDSMATDTGRNMARSLVTG